MDTTPYLALKTAPKAVFDQLAERRTQVRFMLPEGEGDWRGITWGAFARDIRRVGSFLSAIELAPGDRASVFAPNRVEWLSAALGIQAAGGVMVPIYPNSTPDQAGYVVEHSDSRVVFVDTLPLLERLLDAWPSMAKVERIVLLDDALDAGRALANLRARGSEPPSIVEVEPRLATWSRVAMVGDAFEAEQPGRFAATMDAVDLDQNGLMLYTSGTTGRPKGVPLTHRNVATNGHDWLENNGPLLEPGDVDLLWLPFSHIFGFGEACLGNTLGFTSYMTDPYHVLGQLPAVRPTIFMSVPRYWEKLAQAAMTSDDPAEQTAKLAAVTGGRLRFCLSGGAGLKREVKELFHRCGLLIIEGYGLTEASPTLTLNRPDAFRFDTVGLPLPSVQLRLGGDGEILAKGPSIFAGYHKDPEATAAIFDDDGWLKTGDLGRFTDDGFLQIIGRKKEILVTAAGKNIPPANIENQFADDPFVLHAVVYGDAKPYLVAGLWLDVGAVDAHLEAQEVAADQRADALAALLDARVERANAGLARHETIKRFAVMEQPLTVENGLLTTTLKIRRNAVYALFEDVFEGLYA